MWCYFLIIINTDRGLFYLFNFDIAHFSLITSCPLITCFDCSHIVSIPCRFYGGVFYVDNFL